MCRYTQPNNDNIMFALDNDLINLTSIKSLLFEMSRDNGCLFSSQIINTLSNINISICEYERLLEILNDNGVIIFDSKREAEEYIKNKSKNGSTKNIDELSLPGVKISKQSIVLNKKARNLLNAESVELAFDKGNKTIRIKKVSEGGIKIKKTKVYSKGFFEHFKIQEIGKYSTEYKEDEKALFVKIK